MYCIFTDCNPCLFRVFFVHFELPQAATCNVQFEFPVIQYQCSECSIRIANDIKSFLAYPTTLFFTLFCGRNIISQNQSKIYADF